LGNENYDAIIDTPTSKLKVEFTYAINGHDQALRMEFLEREGHVSLTGRINEDTGTKNKGRKLEIPIESVKNAYVDLFELIEKTARGKANREYGSEHILVIIFQDNLQLFKNDRYLDRLKNFLDEQIATLSLDFQRVYVVESSGRVFLPVAMKT
jgi:hypothetical protein